MSISFVLLLQLSHSYTCIASARQLSMEEVGERAARLLSRGHMEPVRFKDNSNRRSPKADAFILYNGIKPEFIVKETDMKNALQSDIVSKIAHTLNFNCFARCVTLPDSSKGGKHSLFQEFIPSTKLSDPIESEASKLAKYLSINNSLTLRGIKNRADSFQFMQENLDIHSYVETWLFNLVFGIKDIHSDKIGIRVVNDKFQFYMFNYKTAFTSSQEILFSTIDLLITPKIKDIVRTWTIENIRQVEALLSECKNEESCHEASVLLNKLCVIKGILLPLNGVTTSHIEEILFWTMGIIPSQNTGRVDVLNIPFLTEKVKNEESLSLLEAYYVYRPDIRPRKGGWCCSDALRLKLGLQTDILEYHETMQAGQEFSLVDFARYLESLGRKNRFNKKALTSEDFLLELGLIPIRSVE